MRARSRDKDRIIICMHAFRDVDFDAYINHLYCIREWSRKYDIGFAGKKGLDAAMARNQIIETCIELKATHAFFLDADHLIHPDSLRLLMESQRSDWMSTGPAAMISGIVCKKGEDFQQIGWVVKDGMYLGIDLPLDGRVYEVGVCAFGCTIINLTKLKKLKKPYFRDVCIQNVKGDLTNTRSDVVLGNMFRDIGEPVFVDTRVLVGHHGLTLSVYPQSSDTMKKMLEILGKDNKLKSGQGGVYYE